MREFHNIWKTNYDQHCYVFLEFILNKLSNNMSKVSNHLEKWAVEDLRTIWIKMNYYSTCNNF